MNTTPDFLRALAHTGGWDEPDEQDFLRWFSCAQRVRHSADRVDIEITLEIRKQLTPLIHQRLVLADYAFPLCWSSGTPDRERLHKTEINYFATVEVLEITEIADTPVSSYVATLRITTHWEAL